MNTLNKTRLNHSCVRKTLCILAILIQPVCLALFIYQYKVDVPFWDQWDLVPFLDKFYSQTLSFQDLFAQHNEHRIFIPKIIMLNLAHFSGWNISYELATNFLIALTTFLAIAYQVRKTQNVVCGPSVCWPLFAISLLVFSFTQWQNWLWGWQIQLFLNVFAVVAGIVLLCKPSFSWLNFLGSLVFGVIASFSFGNGLLYWVIGLLVLVMIPYRRGSVKARAVILWVFVGSAVIVSFFFNYHKPSHHPSLWVFFNQPLEYARYVLRFLGNPASNQHPLFFGVLGIFILFASIIVLFRFQQVKLEVIIPYVAMSMYSIGSAIAIAIVRLGFGSEQAKDSRYVTISNLLWIANVVFLYLLIRTSLDNWGKPEKERKRHKYWLGAQKYLFVLSTLGITIVIISVAFNSISSIHYFKDRYDFLMQARFELLTLEDDKLLIRLYPDADTLKRRAEILKKYNLSVFRNSEAHY